MLRAAVFAVLFAGACVALACGYCVEDKMAAVYDHAVVSKALSQKHQLAFFHIEGLRAPGDATRISIENIAEASIGADKGSVRVSVTSASLSVAFDPRRTSLAALQQDLERRLAGRKLSLMLLQVMDRPAQFSPSVTAARRAGTR